MKSDLADSEGSFEVLMAPQIAALEACISVSIFKRTSVQKGRFLTNNIPTLIIKLRLIFLYIGICSAQTIDTGIAANAMSRNAL